MVAESMVYQYFTVVLIKILPHFFHFKSKTEVGELDK